MNIKEKYIKRCLELAKLSAGKVAPNPQVGAVIVFEDKIIGEGYHQFPGGPHAEINAINALKNKALLPKSAIYISLEPCNNHGKTPPCVDAILKYKIPEVFISIIDPNPLTMGKSIEKLKKAGVKVEYQILTKKGKETTNGFFSSKEKNRPYIILKFAQSLNKKIGIENQRFWISNAFTKRLTHKWRSENNVIMVGSNTLEVDNPSLDNRLFYGNSPVKLVLKRNGHIEDSAAILQSRGKTIVVSEPEAHKINGKNIEQWFIAFNKILLENILTKLQQTGYNSLLVEGGRKLLNSFIQQNLWDEARVFTGNKTINNPRVIDAPELIHTPEKIFEIGNNSLSIYKNPNPKALF